MTSLEILHERDWHVQYRLQRETDPIAGFPAIIQRGDHLVLGVVTRKATVVGNRHTRRVITGGVPSDPITLWRACEVLERSSYVEQTIDVDPMDPYTEKGILLSSTLDDLTVEMGSSTPAQSHKTPRLTRLALALDFSAGSTVLCAGLLDRQREQWPTGSLAYVMLSWLRGEPQKDLARQINTALGHRLIHNVDLGVIKLRIEDILSTPIK